MINVDDLNTKKENTWCPGCPNFGILESVKGAISDLVQGNKIKIKDTAFVSGIGCHAKIFDYLNLSGFYGLHGRPLPVCLGMKAANPELTVLGFGGDGDTYAEGISHFIHNCRRNVDMTMLVHNNQVFALTVGQPTPTSEKGFLDGYPPPGVSEEPLNPLVLALTSGATFVARGYGLEKEHLKELIKQAIEHKGFSFIDILQPCIVFHNVIPYFKKSIYKLDENYNPADYELALKKSYEWDYCFDRDQKIPIGVFYKTKKPVFGDGIIQAEKPWHSLERKVDWKKITQEFR